MSKDYKDIRDLEDLKEEDVRATITQLNKQFNDNWKRNDNKHPGTVADYKPTDRPDGGEIPK